VLTMQASSLAANPFLAEDLVQDTIERALRHQGRFCPGTSLRSWLMRIMRNLFIDWCREKTRHRDLADNQGPELDENEPSVEDPEPIRPWDLLDSADLTAVLQGIDERLRRTFELATFEGLSYEAIATLTGVRVSTVGTRLLRARNRMRLLLLDRLNAPAG